MTEPSRPADVDIVAVGAAACVVIGWFALSTLDTEIAGLRLSFHFYDLWSVLQSPSRLVTGLTDADRLKGVLFGAVCMVVVAAAAVPRGRNSGGLRVDYLGPLVLMLLCGAILYERSATDFFASTQPPDSIGAHLTALANSIANRVTGIVSRHISLGPGAYLAFAASVVLAARALPAVRGSAHEPVASPGGDR